MKSWIAIIIFALLVLALGFFIGQSCDDKVVVHTDANLVEEIKQINLSMKALQDSMGVLVKQRNDIRNYYNYEIIKMDSVYPNSTIAYWDSVILVWTDIIYGLHGFFDIESYKDSTLQSSEDSTTSSESLRREYYPEERKRFGTDSSW